MGKTLQVRISVTWVTAARGPRRGLSWGVRDILLLSGVRLEKTLGHVTKFIRRVYAAWTATWKYFRIDGIPVFDLVHAKVITAN